MVVTPKANMLLPEQCKCKRQSSANRQTRSILKGNEELKYNIVILYVRLEPK